MVLTQRYDYPLYDGYSTRFHTTMVLTQPVVDKEGNKSVYVVSIPLWFSRNWLDLQARAYRFLCVSIPLWFSRNEVKFLPGDTAYYMFPYHYGSHATKSSFSLGIPHIICFHTTMVLTQQMNVKHNASANVICFHTTMVLTQLVCTNPEDYSNVLFPYHYGSHATE